jgi:CRP-like cAMP-binding protein
MHIAIRAMTPERVGQTPRQHGRIVEVLSSIPLLASAAELPADVLARVAPLIEARQDYRLFGEGDPADRIYALIDGQAILTASSYDGDEGEVIEVINAPDCFGEEALLGGARLMTARVLAGSRMIALCPSSLRVDQRLILDHLYRRQRMLVEEVAALKSVPPAQRLARLLLSLTDRTEGPAEIRLPSLKKVIARRIGVEPCTFSSRVLPKLKTVGAAIDGDCVHVEDVARLRAFAGQRALMRGFRRPL